MSTTTDSQPTLGAKLTLLHLALLLQFFLEIVSGVILSAAYRPGRPFESDSYEHTSWLRPIQSFHYWDSSLVIFGGLLLIAALVWTGAYAKTLKFVFLSTLLTFASALGFQLTGNALPFDHHGAQTAVIEASIASRVPVLGDPIQKALLGGDQFSANTVGIWYGLHLAITLLAIAAFALAFMGRKSYAPDVSKKLVGASVIPALLLAFLVASPLGDKATSADFNSFSDRASWYTWPLHGALVMSTRVSPSLGWVGAMLLPGLAGLFIFSLPWIAAKRNPNLGRSGLVLIALLFGCAALFFGGPIDALTGTRNPEDAGAVANAPKAPPIDPQVAAKGRAAFNSAGCNGCHGTDGLKTGGGPSLANVQVKHPDSDYYVKYIKSPTSVDPNSTMPAFPQIPQSQLLQIAEYLRSPNKPGR